MNRRKSGRWISRTWMICTLAVAVKTAALPQTPGTTNGTKASPGSESASQIKALADQHFASGLYHLALPEYLRSYPHYRNLFEVNQRIGWMYLNAIPPDTKAAIPFLRQAYRLKPSDPVVLQDLARATASTRLFDESIPLYRKWLATAPPDAPEPWLEFARALSWASKTPEAIRAYRKYLSLSPQNLGARIELAKLLSQEKDIDGAKDQYDFVLKAQPKNLLARIGRAQILAWRGKVAEGLQEVDDVLKVAPHNFDARLAKAYDLLWLGKVEEAGTLFHDLQQEAPQNRDVAGGLKEVASALKASAQASKQKAEEDKLLLAERSESQGKYGEAVSYYESYLTGHPDDPDAQFRLARVLGWDKRYADSEALLREWVQKYPQRPEGYLQLARVLRWDRDYQDAVENCRRYLELKPNDAAAHFELAGSLVAMRAYQDAAREYRTVSELQPENADAIEGLGRAEILSGDFGRAEKTLAAWREQHPKSAIISRLEQQLEDAKLNKAQELGPSSPAAIGLLENILVADPRNIQARLTLVDFYLAHKDYASATKSLQEAIDLSPHDGALRVKLAEVLSWNKQYGESIDIFRQLAADQPNNIQISLQLARVLSWQKDYSDSLAEYEKLIQEDPSNREVRLEEARVLAWSKQYGRAAQELQMLLDQQPYNFEALVELGRVYAYEADWQKSLASLDGALKLQPGDYDARLAKAQALVWSGDGKAGENILAQLRAEKPKDVGALVAMASAENSLGRPDRALRLLRDARSIAPNDPDAEALRFAIEAPLRPELSLGWSYLRDNESLNVWRYELDARFSLNSRLRNFVTVDVFPSSARADLFGYQVAEPSGLLFSPRLPSGPLVPGPGVLSANNFPSGIPVPSNVRIYQSAVQFLAGGSMRVNAWLSWTAGAGLITLRHGAPDLSSQGFASTESHLIYRVSPAFQIGRHLRLDLTSSRQYWAYTPRAISERIHADELSVAVSYTPTSRSRIELTGFRRDIRPGFLVPTVGDVVGRDFKMYGNGGTLTATYAIFKGETAQLALGYDAMVLGYNHPQGLPTPTYYVNPGVFTPSFYQRHAGLLRFDLRPRGFLDWNLHGTLGPQQIQQGSSLSFSSTAGTRLDFHISPKATLSFTYDYFNTASAFLALPVRPTQAPAYHSNNVGAMLHFRF